MKRILLLLCFILSIHCFANVEVVQGDEAKIVISGGGGSLMFEQTTITFVGEKGAFKEIEDGEHIFTLEVIDSIGEKNEFRLEAISTAVFEGENLVIKAYTDLSLIELLASNSEVSIDIITSVEGKSKDYMITMVELDVSGFAEGISQLYN